MAPLMIYEKEGDVITELSAIQQPLKMFPDLKKKAIS